MFSKIEEIRGRNGYVKFALIDPDLKNDIILNDIINKINASNFNAILIGGSSIEDNLIEQRIDIIKKNTRLPLILFPGSSSQITSNIKSMLYLNLISGRNIRYLIEEHVDSSILIKRLGIETIPTAYILLDGGTNSSVSTVSNTLPLNMNDKKNILSHALAGQFLGNKIIYFDNGSGAKNMIDFNLLKYIHTRIDVPIMVGGGIKNEEDVQLAVKNGASYIVVGNALEEDTK